MPHYAYRAVNANGRQVRGSLAVANEIDLQSALLETGLEVIDCKATRASRGLLALRDRITTQDLIQLCVHLEQMQRAGVPLLHYLADIRDSTGSPRLQATLGRQHRAHRLRRKGKGRLAFEWRALQWSGPAAPQDDR